MRNRRMHRYEVVPQVPTRWDRFCYANRIDDPIVALQNGKRKLIVDWVHRYSDSAYVPTQVREKLGLKSRWDS